MTKIERFLLSIGIEDQTRFDLNFELVSRNQDNPKQVDMALIKKTPWSFEVLEQFQKGLETISYPYTISFSYENAPQAQDVILLFEDWYHTHAQYKVDIKLEGKDDSVIFIYKNESDIDKYKLLVSDFKELLHFLNYNFALTSELREENNLNDDTVLPSQNFKEENAKVEQATTEIKEFEDEFLKLARENLRQMQLERQYKDSWMKGGYKPFDKYSDIKSTSGNVDITGELFGITKDSVKKTKTNKIFLNCFIGQECKEALPLRVFESGKALSKEKIKDLSNGMFVRVRGHAEEDRYSHKINILVHFIDVLPPQYLREDNAKEKRVELHLHTKMSTMDGIDEIGKYCEVASYMGHKAIAITDHGVVQGFPAAQKAAKKYNLKMLYGSELYMVNDELPFALNPKDIKLLGAKIVCFDLETTGLSARYDRITEFGAYKIDKGMPAGSIDFFIDPKMMIPLKIQQKTHITQDMVNGQPTIEESIDKILEFFDDAIIVSHNIEFDIGFLNEALRRMGREPIKNPLIDTLSLSRYLFPESRSHRLGQLSRNLGLDIYDADEAHRANYDAQILSEIFQVILSRMTKENGNLMHSDIAKIKSTQSMLTHMRGSHVTALIKDHVGLNDLYNIISQSHIDYLADVPKTPKRIISDLREHLILGSGCSNGEVFDAALTKSRPILLETMKFYDFIEVQPPENYTHLINFDQAQDLDDIKKYISDIIEAANELNIPVVATGDCHYVSPESRIARDVLISNKAVGGKLHPLYVRDNPNASSPDQHFRSTEEMLKCFEFLGEDKAYEIVVTNSNKIADSIETLKPVQSELHKPEIPNSEQILIDETFKKAKELYGDPLPTFIEERLNTELKGINGGGYSVTYYIAKKIIEKANNAGYIVGSRGSVGSSLAATMFGITEVNPLPPHYRCPHCKHFELVDASEYPSGSDLPNKKCPNCGTEMIGDGQNIPFATFLGFNAEKIPDIDLNFPSDYQQRAFDSTKEIFGENNVFRAGTIETVKDKTAFGYVRGYYEDRGVDPNKVDGNYIAYLASKLEGVKRTTGQHPGGIMVLPKGLSLYDFTPKQYPADDMESSWYTTHFDYRAIHDALLKLDLLGHVDPLALRLMSNLTNLDVHDIPLNDPKVLSLFTNNDALNRTGNFLNVECGASAIPEFGTDTCRATLKVTQPKTFNDLVIISGISHGTNVWAGNAETLITSGTCTLRDVIGCRDDIMTFLISKGVEPLISFKIMEDVRHGKGLTLDYTNIMREHGVPQWYIDSCNKIEYLFPKAHAVAYVTQAVRVGYFKVYYPLEFYAVWFSVRCKAFDIKSMLAGKDAIIARYSELNKRKYAHGIDKLSPKEEDILKMLTIAIEMAERGYKFETCDLYKSLASEFVVDHKNKSLLCPFVVIDGLGEAAANSIIEARENGEFRSKEDLLSRTKLSSTNVEDLSSIHTLDGLGDTDQMSLFDFGLGGF